jgi:NADPH:quinone reductase-like Zn-dependent oxidoreductase
MKAVVFNKYGDNDVVEIKDMPVPSCGPEDVLVKVHAASVNPVDWKMRSGMLRIVTGRRFPKILGRESAGEVITTGNKMTKFKTGDQVVMLPAVRSMGAFAEYACAPEKTTFLKSRTISFEEAACIPIAGLTALQALRDKGRIMPGQKVLINGASGGVGHFAVQIAKIFGANVTGVCSGANRDFVKSLDADRVIDHTKEDFTKGRDRYDIIFDAAAKRSFGACKKILAERGRYVSTLPSPGVLVNRYLTGFLTQKKATDIWVKPNAADMEWMQDQIESGRIKIAIDKRYALVQAKEALAYSEIGKARGKIVLKIGS